jgi:transposase
LTAWTSILAAGPDGPAIKCPRNRGNSNRRSRVGKLTRQGSPQLRWALYEAALSACRPSSPDHADYLALKARGLSHTRASLTIARKLARRSCHALRELGPAALDPVATS